MGFLKWFPIYRIIYKASYSRNPSVASYLGILTVALPQDSFLAFLQEDFYHASPQQDKEATGFFPKPLPIRFLPWLSQVGLHLWLPTVVLSPWLSLIGYPPLLPTVILSPRLSIIGYPPWLPIVGSRSRTPADFTVRVCERMLICLNLLYLHLPICQYSFCCSLYRSVSLSLSL